MCYLRSGITRSQCPWLLAFYHQVLSLCLVMGITTLVIEVVHAVDNWLIPPKLKYEQ